MKLEGEFVTKVPLNKQEFNYQFIDDLRDFKEGDCIVVKYLDPDFSMLLSDIQLIVTENGSSLSHLAIIAMEYGKCIIRVKDITNNIKNRGKLILNYVKEGVEIEIS
ncbi:MAG: PEP-utilizing enzyme [Nanoarchaeota archaeon]